MSDTSGLNMKEILQKELQLDFFLNVSVPAAMKRQEAFPHTAIICNYPRLTEAIEEILRQRISPECFVVYSHIGVTPADVCACLSQIPSNGVFFVKNGLAITTMQKAAAKTFQDAIEYGYVEIKVGRGTSAKLSRIDLPKFSTVVIFEDYHQMRPVSRNAFENIIEVPTISKKDVCKIEITAVGNENDMQFSKEAIEQIAGASDGNHRTAAKLVRWIRDYMLVNNISYSIIPGDFARYAIEMKQ